jgi:hypothetical protein
MSWLPVPSRPITSQLGTICTFSRGITAMRGSPEPSAFFGRMPAPTTSAPMLPLPQLQRPFTLKPPSTSSAGCGGKMPPAKTTSGPLA